MDFSLTDIRVMVRAATQKTGAPLHDEDLEQEASLRAVEAFRRRDVKHPRAFLMKIIHDTVSDHWRRRRVIEDIARIEESLFACPFHAEAELDRHRQYDALRQALERLSTNKRRTVEMFYAEELSIVDIAVVQQRSVSAVKMDLLRSRRELARIVSTLLHRKSR